MSYDICLATMLDADNSFQSTYHNFSSQTTVTDSSKARMCIALHPSSLRRMGFARLALRNFLQSRSKINSLRKHQPSFYE